MQHMKGARVPGTASPISGREFQSRPRRWRGVAGLFVTCLIGLIAAAPATALAAPSPTNQPAGASGWIRFGHFVPSQGPVDVAVDNTTIGTNLVFRSVTKYISVPAGEHTVTVRSATAATTAPPLVVGQADVLSGGAVTVAAVAAPDTSAAAQTGGVALQMFTDSLSPPPAGMAKVRIIQTVVGVPAVGAQLTAAPSPAAATETAEHSLSISPVSYGQASSYVTIPAGTYALTVAAPGSAPLINGQNWPVQAGTVASVVLVTASTGPTVEVLTDAVGASVQPASGGVQTGFGGTAPRPLSPLVLVAAAAGTLLLAVALVRRRLTTRVEI